jgi:hypothetical protein
VKQSALGKESAHTLLDEDNDYFGFTHKNLYADDNREGEKKKGEVFITHLTQARTWNTRLTNFQQDINTMLNFFVLGTHMRSID